LSVAIALGWLKWRALFWSGNTNASDAWVRAGWQRPGSLCFGRWNHFPS